MIKLKEHPLLAHIDSVQLEELQRVCQEVILSKGETLFRQEEVAHFIYFVRQGTLKILKTSSNGQEKIFSIYQRGQFVALSRCLIPHIFIQQQPSLLKKRLFSKYRVSYLKLEFYQQKRQHVNGLDS